MELLLLGLIVGLVIGQARIRVTIRKGKRR
jgi:hypothetical protein